jgi:hypothetical protein
MHDEADALRDPVQISIRSASPEPPRTRLMNATQPASGILCHRPYREKEVTT